jgi:hypothetical protein
MDMAKYFKSSIDGCSQSIDNYLLPMRTAVHGDIRNANDVECLVREFESTRVIHLAGQVAMTDTGVSMQTLADPVTRLLSLVQPIVVANYRPANTRRSRYVLSIRKIGALG